MLDFKTIQESWEYQAILDHYGDKKASRSGVPFINHIDEGVQLILKLEDFPKEIRYRAALAFCLHPMFQKPEDFNRNFELLLRFESRIVALVIEYRNVANACLSTSLGEEWRSFSWENINLSCRIEVNLMLLADKVQNQKDFLIHHKDTHPRKEILDTYFWLWLMRLRADGYFVGDDH